MQKGGVVAELLLLSGSSVTDFDPAAGILLAQAGHAVLPEMAVGIHHAMLCSLCIQHLGITHSNGHAARDALHTRWPAKPRTPCPPLNLGQSWDGSQCCALLSKCLSPAHS